MERDIVILAASEKNGDYCVAGIDVATGEWLRPYSSNHETKGAVPLKQITYADGTHVKLFDVVRIDLLENCQNAMQPENFFYDETRRWSKVDKLSLDEVLSRHGTDDRVKIFFNADRSVIENNLQSIKKRESLLLLKATELEIEIEPPPEISLDQNRRYRLNFNYNDTHYKHFAIGDTRIRRYFEDKKIGTYPFADFNFVVFSLTDKFELNGKNYKVAAQFLGRNRKNASHGRRSS